MSNKLYEENDIQNIANAIRNKNGTEDTYKVSQMSTAINSIEVIEQATAEGESLSLTNTKAMPYSDYVVKGKSEQDGEPSPSNPSDIHSVADDVNLFDVGVKNDYRNYTDGSTINWLTVSNDKLSIVVQAEGATMCYNSKQYLGNKTYTITAKTSMVRGRFYVKLRNSTDTGWLTDNDITISNMSYNSYYNGWFIQNQTNTTLILTVNIPDCLYCVFGFGFASDSVGTTQTISNIKLQEGTVATPYSPYNQGTVTIKQRGKNLAYTGWAENFVTRINYSGIATIETKDNRKCLNYTASAGYRDYDNKYMFKTEWKENTQYTIQCTILNDGAATTNNYNLSVHYTDGTSTPIFNSSQQNAWLNFSFTTALNKTVKYITSAYYGGRRYLDLDTFMVYEGTEESSYEPYQANDYTFQTSPLRSLPNGVKDTIEADGIHRRIINVFLGDLNWLKRTDYSDDNYILYTQTGYTENRYKSLVYCTHLPIVSSNPNPPYDCVRIINISNYGIQLLINKNIATSNNELKTWLQNNNVQLICELEEEVIEPLTQNQATTMLDIIKTGSYEGTTNIYTDEDVKPTMKVGYYKKG